MTELFTHDHRRQIAGRARTLHERLDGPPNEPGPNAPDADRLLERWRRPYDDGAFADRLAHAGLTESDLRDHARATLWPVDEPLPDWIADLESLVGHVVAASPDDDYPFVVPEDVPFRELLAAIVDDAYRRLPSDVPTDALDPMVTWLFDRLERLTVRALYVEFQSYLDSQDSELAEADPDDFTDPPTDHYEGFIDAMLGVGTRNLCLEYPVLARRLTTVTEQWTDAVTEVCRRLREDRSELATEFGVEGSVTELDPLADDSHAGGRVPVRATFESGEAIYKPRGVGGGAAVYAILDRLDDHLSTPEFETPTYLRRDEYGWMEQVSYRDLADEAAVERYYERAGVLLALGYALGFKDCQFENVVTAGEQPTIVDGETAFTPWIAPSALPFSTEIMQTAFRSVLVTTLLPYSSAEMDSERRATVAGLGTESGERPHSTKQRPTIEAVNTDVMAVGAEPPTMDSTQNTPSVDGEDRPPGDYVDAICDGFEHAYDAIRDLHERGRFFTEVAPESLLDGVETRVLCRSTSAYYSMLRSSTARDPLRDGTWLSAEFEKLTFPFFDGWVESDALWPLCSAERRALTRFDVPRITTTPTDATLRHDGDPLDASVDVPGYERAREQVASFDATDRARQTWIIRHSLTDPEDVRPPDRTVDATDDRLRSEAIAAVDEVLEAVTDAPGDDWVSMLPTETDLSLKPANRGIYHGRCGVTLAVAAVYAETGEERYREFVADRLAPILDAIERERTDFGLGGTEGVGSVVYALSVVADLLGEPRYGRHAGEAVGLVTDDLLADDDTFDVMKGSAGTLLGLLAYHDRHGGSDALDRARACGDRLLDGRVTVGGYRAWATIEDDPMTGFAHGSAGIAYALARLAAKTDDQRYVEAVRDALAFEADHYDPDRANWAHAWGSDTYHERWCHGRCGIALARSAIADALGESIVTAASGQAGVETTPGEVLSVTADRPPKRVDDLCCGTLGRVEALVAHAERADGTRADASEALTSARELVGRCLARDDHLALAGRTWSAGNPSFYKGLSGAAYTVLRLRDPDAFPSVLLFE